MNSVIFLIDKYIYLNTNIVYFKWVDVIGVITFTNKVILI